MQIVRPFRGSSGRLPGGQMMVILVGHYIEGKKRSVLGFSHLLKNQ